MKSLVSSNGHEFSVSDSDFDFLGRWKWRLHRSGYLYRSSQGPRRNIAVHIVVAERAGIFQAGMDVDHIDRNKLNNVRENLRACTRSQNCMNRAKQSSGSSIYKGVTHEPEKPKAWGARIKKSGVLKRIGNYFTEKEAAMAYNQAAIELFGEFAFLNAVEQPPPTQQADDGLFAKPNLKE